MSGQEEKPLNTSTPLTRPSSILIVGCGDLGLALAEMLRPQSHQLYGLRRQTPSSSDVNWISADVTQPLSEPLPPVEQVVFCIAPSVYNETAYQAVYVEGLKHVLAALAVPPKHLWVVSSTGVYGSASGLLDETSSPLPDSPMNQALIEMEAVASEQPFPTTIVRLAGIYGPGRTALLQKAHEGIDPQALTDIWTNRIHRDDAARLLGHLMERRADGQAVESLYLGVDDEPARLSDVMDWLRHKLGVTHKDDSVVMRRQSTKQLSNKRLKATGFQFQYPTYREGYSAVIANHPEFKRETVKSS